MLPFLDLIPTHKYDAEMALFSDGHYSRQTPGSPQFMPPGETLVLRDASGLILFGWVKMSFRADGERGLYCSIFRNESADRNRDTSAGAIRSAPCCSFRSTANASSRSGFSELGGGGSWLVRQHFKNLHRESALRTSHLGHIAASC